MLEEEFSALITEHQKLIYKVCHFYADQPQDVEDLFQEIVLNLWRAYPTFEQRSKISTWMYKVALNTAITQLRKAKRRQRREANVDLMAVATTEVATGGAGYNVQRHVLHEAIKRLNKVERAIIVLYLEEHSYREMADIMGISENYVGVQLNRIKKKLRALLDGD